MLFIAEKKEKEKHTKKSFSSFIVVDASKLQEAIDNGYSTIYDINENKLTKKQIQEYLNNPEQMSDSINLRGNIDEV